MPNKLVRVNRFNQGTMFFMDGLRREPRYLRAPDWQEGDSVERTQSFFLVDEVEVERFVELMASLNPGCDVEVYSMERVGHCPAGDYTIKVVSDDGVLPATTGATVAVDPEAAQAIELRALGNLFNEAVRQRL